MKTPFRSRLRLSLTLFTACLFAPTLAPTLAPAIAYGQDGASFAYDLFPETQQDALRACNVDRGEFHRLMGLSQKAFDQDFEGGWRAVAYQDGCEDMAGEIIKAYMLYSAPHAPEQLRILRWHAGQVKAGAGKTQEALALFAGAYNPDPEDGTAWNLYVDATIGFLNQDKESIQTAYDTLSGIIVSEETKASRRKFLVENPNITMPPGFIDEPQNLGVVKTLLECFGRSYSEAYGNCETETETNETGETETGEDETKDTDE